MNRDHARVGLPATLVRAAGGFAVGGLAIGGLALLAPGAAAEEQGDRPCFAVRVPWNVAVDGPAPTCGGTPVRGQPRLVLEP